MENLWGDDLVIENFSLLLSAKIKKEGDLVGWEYRYTSLADDELEQRSAGDEWSPSIVSSSQFVIFNNLCNEVVVSIEDESLREFIEKEGEEFDSFITSLTKTGLIALNDNKLQLTTYECQCVILPDGRFAVADNNNGRLTRWINKQFEKNKA